MVFKYLDFSFCFNLFVGFVYGFCLRVLSVLAIRPLQCVARTERATAFIALIDVTSHVTSETRFEEWGLGREDLTRQKERGKW